MSLLEEIERVQRVAPLLNDPQSRDTLRRYHHDLEVAAAASATSRPSFMITADRSRQYAD